ncbi:MAG: replication factor C subunit 4 [Watsoniomyces obsoletus]|nr:MAG: replication factor C subunit 4 [Watsoniomyces obsoletus]
MNPANAPFDLSTVYTRRLREMASQAIIFACPFCSERKIFHLETRLKEHIRHEHANQVPASATVTSASSLDDPAWWNDIRAQARTKGGTGPNAFRSRSHQDRRREQEAREAQQGPRASSTARSARMSPTPTPTQVPPPPLPSSPPPDPARTSPVQEIANIQQLSLHGQPPPPPPPAQEPLTPLGTRKRAAGPELGTSPPIAFSTNEPARRSRARAGTYDGPHRPWPATTAPPRLFDPATDDPMPRPERGTASPVATFDPRAYAQDSRAHRDARRRGTKPGIPVVTDAPRRPLTQSDLRFLTDPPNLTQPARRTDPDDDPEQRPPPPGGSAQGQPGTAPPGSAPAAATAASVATGIPPPDVPPRLIPGHAVSSRSTSRLMRQPETRPISQEKLVTEVKTIYAGLVMVEAKCNEVVSKQEAAAAAATGTGRPPPKLIDEQWQALVALHRNLLYDHHDFFLASQHPSAGPALRRLATKYAMPARLWRHGIHSFLELLRHRLPDSLEHMLNFVYLAYSMMALLYETVPTFEDTWVECLGDLGRYRMAIEDDDLRDRETWANVARFWYSKAADKDPTVGRLYHHLAILARPQPLRQLYFYARSLTCVQPFLSARESVLTLFDPLLKSVAADAYPPPPARSQSPLLHHPPARSPPMEEHFVKIHAVLFTGRHLDQAERIIDEYLASLDKLLDRVTGKYKEQGVHIAVANAAALFEYGSTDARLKLAYDQEKLEADIRGEHEGEQGGGVAGSVESMRPATGPDFRSSVQMAVHSAAAAAAASTVPAASSSTPKATAGIAATGPSDLAGVEASGLMVDPTTAKVPSELVLTTRRHATRLTLATLTLSLRRVGDAHIMPYVHVSLVQLWSLAKVPGALEPLASEVPWTELANYLNAIARPHHFDERLRGEAFPTPKDEKEQRRPLREDYAIVGQIWTEHYFPADWFTQAHVDDEERELELPSMAEPRQERVLWLAVRIASFQKWLYFDSDSARFRVDPAFERSPSSAAAKLYLTRRSSTLPYSADDGDDEDIEEADAGEEGDVEMSGPEDDTVAAETLSTEGTRKSVQNFTPAASFPAEEMTMS